MLLLREGYQVSKNWLYRLYREEGLSLRYRPNRKRRAQMSRPARAKSTAGNQAWSLDFVADQLSNGQRFRALIIIDVFTSEKFPFRGLALVDAAKVATLPGATEELKQGMAGALQIQDFGEIMRGTVRKLGNLEVKVGVVQAILSSVTLANSYKEMKKAGADKIADKTVNFVGGVAGLVGGITETTGNMLEKTAWGAIKTSWQFKFQAIQIESRASWMTGLGKILGVVGGVVGGVFAVKDSYEMRERHPVFAIAMLTLGTFSIAAFFACVFGDGWGGVCFGIGDCNNYFRCCAI